MPRSPWLGVYNTGSGLPALMDSHPAWFSPGRPHCVILWLDGSARCPLPLTAQAGAARLLGIFPVALGQRGPYAYTDLFGCQGTKIKLREHRLFFFCHPSGSLIEGGLFTPSSLLASGRPILHPLFQKFLKFVQVPINRHLRYVQFHGNFVLREIETGQEKDFPVLLRDSLGNSRLHILQGGIQVK